MQEIVTKSAIAFLCIGDADSRWCTQFIRDVAESGIGNDFELKDVRWNQGGARNLGVVYAKSDNILITDLDLAFPEETLRALVGFGPCRKALQVSRDQPGNGQGG